MPSRGGLPCSARDEDAPQRWTFAAGVETDFPVDVAARLEVEAPFRLRLSTSVGFLPSPYVAALNARARIFGRVTDQLHT